MTINISDLVGQAREFQAKRNFGGEAHLVNMQIITLNPTFNLGAYLRLGECYVKKGKFKEAEKVYGRAIELFPRDNIASRELRELDSQRVMYKIDQMKSPEDLLALGIDARKNKKTKVGVYALERALSFNPSPQIRLALAAAYRADRQPGLAIEQCEIILNENPEDAVATVVLAAVRRDTGEYASSQKSYEQVLKIDPNNTYALNGMGGVSADLGRWEDAKEYFEKAAELNGPESIIGPLERLLQRYAKARNSEKVNEVKNLMLLLGINNS